jgi:hypothetical protein
VKLSAIAALVLLIATAARAAQITLPIYIEDNHAGSFYWLAAHLPLDEPVTLVHFDAHSDASSVFDSDQIREQLRRVTSKSERAARLQRLRDRGAVQCFDWIEPLMPLPFARVLWVNGRHAIEKDPAAQLDGELEASPRTSGTLAQRFTTTTLDDLRIEEGTPLVVSIDLDLFAGMPAAERAAAFERVWSWTAAQRNLRAITVAISRPYLTDDAEADALVRLTLEAAFSLPTARVYFEPFQRVANDRSRRATELRKSGEEVPAYDPAAATQQLRALILANRERFNVQTEAHRWNALLDTWSAEAPLVRLQLKGRQPSTDNIWRVPANEPAEIELITTPWYEQVQNVTWIVERPVHALCNLTATRADQPGFARGAPPRPRNEQVVISTSSGRTLPIAQLREFFDRETGCGSVRVKARTSTRETPAIEVRRFTGTGFRAALLEQFGLPYLFGSGSLRDAEGNTGPETGWGADCSNFIVYALRRQGLRVPWSNPKQLRNHLEPLNGTTIDLERGVLVHLGSHVAAVVEDRDPLGTIDANDIVAHQLEGKPELLSLGELLRQRGTGRYDLLGVPQPQHRSDVIIGGDVMLGRTVGERIRAGEDPFLGIREVLAAATLRLANLECVISTRGKPAAGKRYHLRAPAGAATVLRDFHAVSLANNHALDFGADALRDSIARLRSAGVAVVRDEPQFFGRVAVIAINDTEAPADRAAISRHMAAAQQRGSEFIIALVHWGDENTLVVNERQQAFARWLVNEGVDLIAGSHPHVVQPLDFYRGRAIAYSLGNLVFDGAPNVRSWNAGALLEVGITGRARRSPTIRMIPVQLDTRGFPHSVAPPQQTLAAETR